MQEEDRSFLHVFVLFYCPKFPPTILALVCCREKTSAIPCCTYSGGYAHTPSPLGGNRNPIFCVRARVRSSKREPASIDDSVDWTRHEGAPLKNGPTVRFPRRP
ncbi:unnamed protein product [Ectocarpus sp. 12 AP-2014]